MKGKPIEPGCLAMVVTESPCEENNGRVVRVLYRVEAGHRDPHTRLVCIRASWMVQTTGRLLKVVSMDGDEHWVQRRGYTSRRLIRIDDGETHLPAETKEKEVPTKEDVY